MESISLLELNQRIAEVINAVFEQYTWVVAEISEIRTAANGHCYLELVEKAKHGNAIVARQRATIWNNRWILIRKTFETTTNQTLKAGMKILVRVQVQMHEAYGLSLNIIDIDPSFTLGEMTKRKQEIIRQLTEEGLIDMNKEVKMPLLPQRIAVISAKNAAGYGDFCHQIQNNALLEHSPLCGRIINAKFYVHLFPATMQGEKTENSIIAALDHIYNNVEKFDVVVIIRGGGGTADLSSFDSYELAVNIANFPLPVIVGIGHERDNSVLDIVAHTSVKTPTAAAAMLIDIMGEQITHLADLQKCLKDNLNWKIESNKVLITRYVSVIKTTHTQLREQIANLSIIKEKIKMCAHNIIYDNRHTLELTRKTIELTRPENVLRRGYSITRVNGHAVKSADEVREGTLIETQTFNGVIKSVSCQVPCTSDASL